MQGDAAHSAHSIHFRLKFIAVNQYVSEKTASLHRISVIDVNMFVSMLRLGHKTLLTLQMMEMLEMPIFLTTKSLSDLIHNVDNA